MTTHKKRAVRLAIILPLAALVLAALLPETSVVAGYVVGGWYFFLVRVIPQLQINPGGVAMAAICLAGVIFVGHATAKWLWSSAARDQPNQWKKRWALGGLLIFLLMFACGLSAAGITHQTAWLARSKEPLFRGYHIEAAYKIVCGSNLRQIGLAIQQYTASNEGHLPSSLAILTKTTDLQRDTLSCRDHDDNADAPSYVYHGASLKLPVSSTEPIVCEPLRNHKGVGMNVLFGDFHVQWLAPDEARSVMQNSGH